MDDRLRLLWDFDDLDATERSFGAQLDREDTGEGRAEVLTQLARVHGLRGEFDAGDALIDEAAALAGGSVVTHARIDLERGRLRRSSGDRAGALPLFESAFAIALGAGHEFIAVDAAHMAALAAADRSSFVAWTERGVALAEEREDASYWLGPLLNNLGWEYYGAGDLERALDAFERALAARESEPEKPGPIEIARYAVGKTLRTLGRPGRGDPAARTSRRLGGGRGRPGWLVPRGARGGLRGGGPTRGGARTGSACDPAPPDRRPVLRRGRRAPSQAQRARLSRYSGMFPCLRFGAGSRFESAVSSAEISTGRVRRGSMTSST